MLAACAVLLAVTAQAAPRHNLRQPPAWPPLSPPSPPEETETSTAALPSPSSNDEREVTPSDVADIEAAVAAKETAEAAQVAGVEPAKGLNTTSANADALKLFSSKELTAETCEQACRPVLRPLNLVLPNVLIVGDQISQSETGYLPIVRALLTGVADVQHAAMFNVDEPNHIPRGVCGTSYGVDACMDAWLGKDTVWDVIVFNWGLHDIAPSVFGKVNADDYVAAVRRMYIRMLYRIADKGKIIWHTTTPVPPGQQIRTNADVVKLNALVDTLWSSVSHSPVVNDLYKAVVHACHANLSTRCYPEECGCPQLQDIDSDQFTASGKQFVGMLVASAIKDALR